jgi:hypothetical protein
VADWGPAVPSLARNADGVVGVIVAAPVAVTSPATLATNIDPEHDSSAKYNSVLRQ